MELQIIEQDFQLAKDQCITELNNLMEHCPVAQALLRLGYTIPLVDPYMASGIKNGIRHSWYLSDTSSYWVSHWHPCQEYNPITLILE